MLLQLSYKSDLGSARLIQRSELRAAEQMNKMSNKLLEMFSASLSSRLLTTSITLWCFPQVSDMLV